VSCATHYLDNQGLSFWIQGTNLFLQGDGLLWALPWLAMLVMDLK
jgi:hypothetical protein